MTDFASIPAEGQRIADELVTITATSDLDDLRPEAAQRVLVRAFLGQPRALDSAYRVLLAVTVMQRLLATVQTLSDELAERDRQQRTEV